MTFTLNIKNAAEIEEERQVNLRANVTAERDRRLLQGAVVSVDDYGPIPVQGRQVDQINLIALADSARDLITAGVTAAVVPFRDADNVMHSLTPAQMLEVARKGKEAAAAIYAASWLLKDGATVPDDFADDTHWP